MTAGVASADVTVHVTTTVDEHVKNGQCSLREAMAYADGTAEPECGPGAPDGIVTVSVPAGCYGIAGGLDVLLLSNSPVTLVVLKGSRSWTADVRWRRHGDRRQARWIRVVALSPSSTAAITGVTLTGGQQCAGFGGCTGAGGVVYNVGHLTLDNVLVTGNAATPGVDQMTPGTGAPGGNGGNGGGIYNGPGADLTVTNSAIVGNAAGNGGAGADGLGNSGASGGTGGAGGGIYNNGGSVALSNSTVSGNTAGAGGTGGLGDPSANPPTSGGDGGPGGAGGGIISRGWAEGFRHPDPHKCDGGWQHRRAGRRRWSGESLRPRAA